MPHGINLSIDKGRVMDAPTPGQSDLLRPDKQGGPAAGSDQILSEDVVRPQGQPEDAERGGRTGMEQRAFKIGKRESSEAAQAGQNPESQGSIQDMAQGILENAGLITSGMSPDRVSSLVQAFTEGWGQGGSTPTNGPDSDVLDQGGIFI